MPNGDPTDGVFYVENNNGADLLIEGIGKYSMASFTKIVRDRVGGTWDGSYNGFRIKKGVVIETIKTSHGMWTPNWLQLGPNNAAPSVDILTAAYVSNTSATIVTSLTSGVDGQRLTLLFTNGNTTLPHGTGIKLAGAADFVGSADDTLELVNRSGVWYETNRSVN